jgi:hypothetical protein
LPANLKLCPDPSSFEISKFNTPEILVVGYDFDAHVPPIIPLQPFPNDHGLDRPPCGQIREPQTLLQFEFLRAHK